jgi:transcriptional regulator with XRE-family HTH domain
LHTTLKQEDFAQQIKVTPTIYGRIERGVRAASTEELEKIAQAYGLTASELMDVVSTPPGTTPLGNRLESAKQEIAHLKNQNATLNLRVLELKTLIEARTEEIERLYKLLADR